MYTHTTKLQYIYLKKNKWGFQGASSTPEAAILKGLENLAVYLATQPGYGHTYCTIIPVVWAALAANGQPEKRIRRGADY